MEDLISHSSLSLTGSSPSLSRRKFLRRFLRRNSSNDDEQGVSSLADDVSLSRLHSRRSTASSERDQVLELEGAREPKILSTRTLKLSSSIDAIRISNIKFICFRFVSFRFVFGCFIPFYNPHHQQQHPPPSCLIPFLIQV